MEPSPCRVIYWVSQGEGFTKGLPFVPDMKQRSGIPGRRQSPAGGCREARPGCGSARGSPPLTTSRPLKTGEVAAAAAADVCVCVCVCVCV